MKPTFGQGVVIEFGDDRGLANDQLSVLSFTAYREYRVMNMVIVTSTRGFKIHTPFAEVLGMNHSGLEHADCT